MAFSLTRLVSAISLATVVAGGSLGVAQACMINERYEPDKPFYENYFYGAEVIFRGRPVSYRFPEPHSMTIIGNRVELTFEVVETYQGEQRDSWTAVWVTIAFPKAIDVLAFKHEIADDLVVVLDDGSDVTGRFGELPFVAHRPCGQPGMRSYTVMEPVLRRRGLID